MSTFSLEITVDNAQKLKRRVQSLVIEKRTQLLELILKLHKEQLVLFEKLPSTCSPEKLLSSALLLDKGVDAEDLTQNGLCIFQSLLRVPPLEQGSALFNQRMLEYLEVRNVTHTGQNYTLVADFGSANNFFMIRADKVGKCEALHECIVGIHGLNNASVPNFAYTYGGFFCSPPEVDDDGNVLSWCGPGKEKVVYAVCENIGSKTLESILHECTLEEFLNLFCQVVLALRSVPRFTHYNLTPSKIFLRDLPTLVSIGYETEQGTQYLNTQRLAIISDYRYSTLRLEDRYIGNPNYIGYGVNPTRNFPLTDIYRLLITCHKASAKNPPVQDLCAKLLTSYFSSTINPAMMEETIGMNLYWSNEYANLGIDSFLLTLRAAVKLPFLQQTYSSLYTPREEKPIRVSDQPISNFNDYYYLRMYLEPRGDTLASLILDYSDALVNQRKQFDTYREKLVVLRNRFATYRINLTEKNDYATLLDPQTLHKIRNLYMISIATQQIVMRLKNMWMITRQVVDWMGKADDLKLVTNTKTEFETNAYPSIRELSTLMAGNSGVLNVLIQTPIYSQAVEDNPFLTWYAKERVELDRIYGK